MTKFARKGSRGLFAVAAVAALVVSAACHNGSDRYRVSGVLSGLGSGSVTLALNGAEQIDLGANGRFTFETLLEKETAYEVTVVDRPDRTVATVSNGTGMVEGWVMDVGVNLEAGYLIGGTVSGLNGDDVQLSLNGGAPITVDADGGFQFADLLTAGASYAVSVTTEPAGRTVQLDAESGTVPGADVGNVSVRARSWHHPSGTPDALSLESGDSTIARIAANAEGEAVIAYLQHVPGQLYSLFLAERHAGVWTGPAQDSDRLNVGTNAVIDCTTAMNANGDAVIAWYQQVQGQNPSVFASVRRSGTWTHPTQIADALSIASQGADYVHAGIDDSGKVSVMWRQFDGSVQHLYLAENEAGTWTHPAGLNDTFDTIGRVGAFALAVAPTGEICVVYTVANVTDGGSDSLVMSEKRGGNWTHAASTAEGIQLGDYPTDIAVRTNRTGQALITWQDWDGNEWRAMASVYDDGAWTHPGSFADALSPETTGVWDVRGALADGGECDVMFTTSVGVEDAMFCAHRGSDGTWTRPTSLSDRVTPSTVSVDGTSCASRDGHLVVCVYDTSTDTIYTCERVRGTWATGTTAITLANHQPNDVPSLAFDARGNLFAAHVDELVNTFGGTFLRTFVSEYR